MSRVPLPAPELIKLSKLAEIARGGMGSVELARVEDGRLKGQVVAIKRLHANIANDPQFVSMFLDEAWMTSALHHPNVVAVAAYGTDDRGMFLAIEFVQGISLSRLLKEAKQNKEPFAERTVANICSQICAGLTAAHALRDQDGALLGLVHRDLTPGNVLVRFDGMVKIVDFGIAKAEQRISHTQTGQLKGKPAYMAPEQARGGKVDQRADIFSFGVMMFEFLAGRRPWMSKAAFDVMMEIMNDPPPDLAELRPGLNPEFIAIIHKCIEKKPEDRFSSAAEVQARLDGWRAQKGFIRDDQQSLANFVLRNSTAQIKWYEAALRGDFALTAAESFKDLEEKIDADREAKAAPKKKPPPLIRPAAGRPADPPRPSEPPRQPEPMGPAPRAPLPTMPELPTHGPTRPLAKDELLELPPSRTGNAMPLVKPPPSSDRGGLGAGMPSERPLTGAGTEYMAISPFAASSRSEPPKPSVPAPAGLTGAGTEYMAISPLYTAASRSEPPRPHPSAPPPYAPRPELGGSGVFTGPPGLDSAAANPGPAPDKPASHRGLIVLLILILLLGAAAFFTWQRRIRHSIVPDKAPAAVETVVPSSSTGP